jgi:hypothetical protein
MVSTGANIAYRTLSESDIGVAFDLGFGFLAHAREDG